MIWTRFVSMILDTMKEQVDGCQWNGFLNVGTRTGTIKQWLVHRIGGTSLGY